MDMWNSVKIRKRVVKCALQECHKKTANFQSANVLFNSHGVINRITCQIKTKSIFNNSIDCVTLKNYGHHQIYKHYRIKIIFVEPTMWICTTQKTIKFCGINKNSNEHNKISVASHRALNNGFDLLELKHDVSADEFEFKFTGILFHQDCESGYLLMTNTQFENLKCFIGTTINNPHCNDIFNLFCTYTFRTKSRRYTIVYPTLYADDVTYCVAIFNPRMRICRKFVEIVCENFTFKKRPFILIPILISGKMYYIKYTSLKNILITLIYLFELHTQHFTEELYANIRKGLCDSRTVCKQLHKIALPMVKKQNIDAMIDYIQNNALNDALRMNVLNTIIALDY